MDPVTSAVPEQVLAKPDVVHVQRRTVRVLVASQILGGVGVGAGFSILVLLAEDILGSAKLAGLASTASVLGAALIAVPLARVTNALGRRAGLSSGYLVAIAGALVSILAAVVENFPLLVLGSALLGAANAVSLQARYAATDLALPERRARDLSTVVWATTVGAVSGPNLTGPGAEVADLLGLPDLAGPLVFSLVGFCLAAACVWFALRPDPLLSAREAAGEDVGRRSGVSVRHAIASLRDYPAAMIGLAAVALAHSGMVGVMVMTPLHMDHGGATLTVIGFVISIHILGMFAFSPIVGRLVDRLGPYRVIVVGLAIFGAAFVLAGSAPEGHSWRLTAGLFLLGLGWSCCLVAGSTQITAAVPLSERPAVQGFADLSMGLAAGASGALAGVIVGVWSFGALNLAAGVVLGCLVLAFVRRR